MSSDAHLKKELERMGSAYVEGFNKQDGVAIAALYAAGGIFLDPAGPRTDIAELYNEVFKAGFDYEEMTFDQVWSLGTNAALAIGQHRIAGKSRSGAPIEHAGRWTAVYVREAGDWKIRMLSAIPKPR